MFYAIIPSKPPVFAVQPNFPDLQRAEHADLLAKLERHFMSPIALVSWDQDGQFLCYGTPCSEEDASSDDLIWRRLDLPAESEIPF